MHKIKNILLFLGLLLCFQASAQVQIGGDSINVSYERPKEYVIGGVLITGTKYLDENVLVNLSGLIVGDTIDVPGEKTAKAIQNLWKQGLFSDVKLAVDRIQGNYIFFVFQLQEKPRLSKFNFKGVSKSEAEKIREKIRLERDKVITESVIASTKSSVKNFYTEKGFMNATVEIKQEKDSTLVNHDNLEIVVNRGRKVRIKEINIEGNEALSDRKIRKAMKNTKQKVWWKIFTSSKYIEDNFEEDKGKIIAKYSEKGYRDAKITSSNIEKLNEKYIRLNLTIDEGHKYFFRNITWIGNTKHTSQELTSILGIKKGDVYDQSVLEQRLYMNQNGRDVSSLYMDDGYLFFQVNPVEIAVENDSIDLEMRIVEGKQARINKISVAGNTKTNDRVIMREIRTKPGQLFNRSDVIRTQRELAQLGYFDQEKLNINTKPDPAAGTVDLEYVVEEKASDQFELQGGYGANQLVGSLGVTLNNFSARNMFRKGKWRPIPSGDGQKLSARYQTNGKYYNSYNVSFTEPWLGGKKPNSFTVSGYKTKQSNGIPRGELNHSSIQIMGGSVGLGRRLKWPDDFFTIFYEADYQYYEMRNYSTGFLFSDGFANNIYGQVTLSRNSIDAPIYPRTGSQFSVSAQFTPPYSLFNDIDYSTASPQKKYKFIEYHKWKFNSTWYSRIAGNLVLNTKIQYGFLGMYNREVGASPFERFYIGGDGLTQGFLFDGRELIALRGYESYNSITPTGGGTIFDKYTIELRHPITLNPTATIFVLGFAEGGNAWTKFSKFNPFDLKRSAGFGVRIFLPIFGLLGLDYGWNFDKSLNPSEPPTHLSFTIGQQF